MAELWVDEHNLVSFNLAVVSVLGIALSIVVSTKGVLFLTSLGFVLYFGVCLGLLLMILGHTLGMITNPTLKLAAARKGIEASLRRNQADEQSIRKQLDDELGIDPVLLQSHRATSSQLAATFSFLLFTPIPWILATRVDETVLAANLNDLMMQLVIAIIFVVFLFLTAKFFSSALPWNTPTRPLPLMAFTSMLFRILAVTFAIVAYMPIALTIPVDLTYISEVGLLCMLFVMFSETAYFYGYLKRRYLL